jgi:pimeloyl-ACP methyl ester carboxylesterase
MTEDGAPFESTFPGPGSGSNTGCIRLMAETERPGIVYSRPGHGWSGPIRKPRTPQFMHREALSTFFYFIRELEVSDLVLIGHPTGRRSRWSSPENTTGLPVWS